MAKVLYFRHIYFFINSYYYKVMKIHNLILSILCLLCWGSCKEDESVVQEINFGLSATTQSVGQSGGIFTINVTTESDIEITVSCPDWISEEKVTKSEKRLKFTFSVVPNNNAKLRSGTVVFTSVLGSTSKSVEVTQKGRGDYNAEEVDIDNLPSDTKKVKIIGAKSYQGTQKEGPTNYIGGTVDALFDDDITSLFQSAWGMEWFGKNYDPWTEVFEHLKPELLKIEYYTLDFYFADNKEESINSMIYYPRSQNNKGGVWGKFDIEASTYESPEKFEKVGSGDCGQKEGVIAFISFDKEVTHPHTIRLKVYDSYQNYISAGEIEFYGQNDVAFDTTTLFADNICSTLKTDITLEDINACEYPFFKKIATYIYYNRDEYTQFRVNEFKAYPHPDVHAKENKVTPYDLLDNVTGIYVKEGSTLVAFVDNPSVESIGLRVVNFDTPEKDGWYSYTNYLLRNGMNRLKMSQKGLVYVMYHTSAYETSAPVKIHFASGDVNGYFDNEKNAPEDWNKLLAANVAPHFDVIGKYAHIVFPVNDLKKENDGKGFVQFYDDLVYNEQEFQGAVKYDRLSKNRMLFSVFYSDSYMYATNYHTGYNVSTMGSMCSLENLKQESWGPSHEVGHMNQTRPGLKWTGMTEVTNNIQSLYIQHLSGNQSRLEKNGDYEPAMNTAFVDKCPHIKINYPGRTGENVFCQLVPFWQLYLYMVKVANKPDFYKDLYEEIRRTDADIENARNAGQHQMEFAYTCCKIAQLDLTDFFENWGYIREADCSIVDYGMTGIYKISETDVNNMKERIRKLGFAKPKHDFKYICESNMKTYQENATVTGGNVIRSGNKIQVTGCNGVAYKVYNKDNNRLVYVSNRTSFEASELPTNIEVKAVAPDGKETVLNMR